MDEWMNKYLLVLFHQISFPAFKKIICYYATIASQIQL